MLCLVSHVSWRCGGLIKMCKGEIRRGEPADQSGVRCSTVSYGVGCRGLSGQG